MINWSKQHCGVHQASVEDLIKYMPDLEPLLYDFPDKPSDFIWDVKVHMLMPGQYPCIPNWHYDNVPRINNAQDFNLVKPEAPMYLWVSGNPLPKFRKNGVETFIEPETWTRFTQLDEHTGTASKDFTWRGFVRATHKDIVPQNKKGESCLRLHSQVYLDAANFKW